MLQLLPSALSPQFFSSLPHISLLGISHLSLSLSPSNLFPKPLPLAPSISLSFPGSPIFSPCSPISVCHILLPPPSPYPSALLSPFLPRPDSPSQGQLRKGGSGRRRPPPFLQWGKWLGREGEKEGVGEGRWEHTGSVGPFKGSFMDWREAETKRPRRRDTARASLGGDKQT